MYRCILFDLDGTLLNTLADLAAALNRTLSAFDMPERTLDEVRRFVGDGIRKLVERAVPENTKCETIDEVLDAFKRDYGQNSAVKTAPYPGVHELLGALRAAGKQVAIVSNKADFAVQTLAEHFFSGEIDLAIGENEAAGIRKKPAPDMLDVAMRYLHASPAETVYVGDSEVDFETARQAGLDVLLVDWGFRDRALLTSLAESATDGQRASVLSKTSELSALLLSGE